MQYEIGTMVVLLDGRTIYITGYDKESDEYKGFNAEENNPQNEITFVASDVNMKI